MGDSLKWVKSKRRRKKREKREKDRTMVITMANLRMAHASTHGARKPPGPIVKAMKDSNRAMIVKPPNGYCEID